MDLEANDIAYLAKAVKALETGKVPEMPLICPECDEVPEPGDDAHITLVDARWGKREVTPIVLIGCEGYHTLRDHI
jgi:hypothetical protein